MVHELHLQQVLLQQYLGTPSSSIRSLPPVLAPSVHPPPKRNDWMHTKTSLSAPYIPSELFALLERYIISFTIRPAGDPTTRRAPVRHECKQSTCSPFIEMGDDFICRFTGNIHRCTSGECSETITCRTHKVCQLTGRILPLDPDPYVGFDDDDNEMQMDENCVRNYDDDCYDDYSMQLEMSNKRPRIDATLEIVTQPSAPAPAPPPHATSPVVKKVRPHRLASEGRVTNQLFDSLGDTATGYVRDVLGRASKAFDDDEVNYVKIVQENILYFWSEVITTNHYRQSSLSYPFRFHCAVILMELRNGCTHAWYDERSKQMKEVELIEKNDDVCKYAPPLMALLKKIRRDGGGRPLTHSGYLRASKFFKACIKEIMQRPDAIRKIQQRENTPLQS